MIRCMFYIWFLFFSLVACSEEMDWASKEKLVAEASALSKKTGVNAWNVVVVDGVFKRKSGEAQKIVYIYSHPERVRENLCMAKVYIYSASLVDGVINWRLADHEKRGYSSVAAAVFDSYKSGKTCLDASVNSYFDVHNPIDDFTILEIYKSINKIAKEKFPDEKYRIISIRLSRRPGFTSSHIYNTVLEVGVNSKSVSFELKLTSADFSINDGKLRFSPD